jgi:hypothetical protein
MRWRVVLAALVIGLGMALAGGCSFPDPDLSGTTFACEVDAECSPGQTCVGMRCQGMPDGGSDDGPQGSMGVACGNQGTCDPDDQCCVSFGGSDFDCDPAGNTCLGWIATCDGPEDCPGGACCSDNGMASCGDAGCNAHVCLSDDGCSGATPKCCFVITGNPWGICNPSGGC